MSIYRIALVSCVAIIAASTSNPLSARVPAAPAVTNIAGDWLLGIDLSVGHFDMKMTVEQSGSDFTCRIQATGIDVRCVGTISGHEVKLAYDYDAQALAMRIEYVGLLTDGEIAGHLVGLNAAREILNEGTFLAKRP